jgi:hypothetical protein
LNFTGEVPFAIGGLKLPHQGNGNHGRTVLLNRDIRLVGGSIVPVDSVLVAIDNARSCRRWI